MSQPDKNKLTAVAVIAIATAVILVYILGDPLGRGYAPRCVFKSITGYDCPGCGFQRALAAALHGDWSGAWRANPFLFFALPAGALYAVVETMPGRFGRRRRGMSCGSDLAARRLAHASVRTVNALLRIGLWTA